MILRRVIEHFKKQEWTAVFLDFVIVVAGVFIGIQLGNWNESRNFSARERELLGELRTEIERSIDSSNQKIAAFQLVGAAGARSLEFLRAGGECENDCWPVVIDFLHASQWQGIWVTKSVYQDMRRIGLPRSRKVIDAVEAYYAQNESSATTVDIFPAYRTLVRGLIPLEIQDAYWQGCYRVVDGQESYGFDCRTEAAENLSAETTHAIASNPNIVPTLTEWAGFVRAVPQTLVDQNSAGELAIAAIDEELERWQ